MDIYNLVMKIPYMLMLLIGITLILQLFVGGLNSISLDIDTFDQTQYRSAVVLENTLSVEESSSGDIDYSYDHRRAVTPIEFYTNQISSSSDGPGYKKRDSTYCYIPKVAGLDGEDFGFYISKTDPDMSLSSSFGCTQRPNGVERSNVVFSPVLLVREGDPVPARLYIYAR